MVRWLAAAVLACATAARADDDVRTQLAAAQERVRQLEAELTARDDARRGVVPGILFGPRLSIVSAPTPAAGIEVRSQLFGISAEYGFLPEFRVGDVTANAEAWSVAAKVYPLRGGFYLGCEVGHYTFTAREADTMTASSTWLAPKLGWISGQGPGFFLAIDAGWGFPLSYESTSTSKRPTGLAYDIRLNADRYLGNGVPLVGLLEIGWFL